MVLGVGITSVVVMSGDDHSAEDVADVDNPSVGSEMAEDPATVFASFAPLYLDEFLSRCEEADAKLIEISYDVRKTDSLLNPVVGIMGYVKTTESQMATRYQASTRLLLRFAFKDGQWQLNSGTFEVFLGGGSGSGTQRPLKLDSELGQRVLASIDAANAKLGQ